MQFRNIFTRLVIGSLGMLFFTLTARADEDPRKPRVDSPASTSEFQCGVYKGSEREIFRYYYHNLARLKRLQKTGALLNSRDFVFDDVAVIEDDGSVLLQGVNSFDTDNTTFRFSPNANNGYDVSTVTFNYDSDLGIIT